MLTKFFVFNNTFKSCKSSRSEAVGDGLKHLIVGIAMVYLMTDRYKVRIDALQLNGKIIVKFSLTSLGW